MWSQICADVKPAYMTDVIKEETKQLEQEKEIEKLYEQAVKIADKANEKNYKPTHKERQVLENTYDLLKNMRRWF